MSEGPTPVYHIDEKLDHAIDLTMRRVFYGGLIGGLAGLVLARGMTGRVASLAFGAGFGAGGSYFQNQKTFEQLWQGSSAEASK